MLVIPTVDDWWRLGARYPDLRRPSCTVLKDYGYMALRAHLDDTSPRRILEFGHGFNESLFAHCAGRDDVEVWGVDDHQALPYFPEREAWTTKYDALRAKFPDVRFCRGLLGGADPALDALEDASFDLIGSVSVLEELEPDAQRDVLHHCRRLLRPGGHFVNTCDQYFKRWDKLRAYVDLHAECGFTLEIPDALRRPMLDYQELDLTRLLLENPTSVMCWYQMGQGEERRYTSHWTTVLTVATAGECAEGAQGAPSELRASS